MKLECSIGNLPVKEQTEVSPLLDKSVGDEGMYLRIFEKMNVEIIVGYLLLCIFKISSSDNLLDIISYFKV